MFYLLSCLFIAASSKASAAVSSDATRQPPYCPDCNIILISLDTLRADSLGTYGYHRDTTPNIDRLARRGLVFLNAYAQAPSTFPSHMSIITSQYLWTHNVVSVSRDSLPTETVTLPMLLKAQGYRTVWAAPLDDNHLSLKAGFEKGFDEFIKPYWYPDERRNTVFSWLEENAGHKFFMFLHTYRIHDPYLPNKKSILRFTQQLPQQFITRKDLKAEEVKQALSWKNILRLETISNKPKYISLLDSPEAVSARGYSKEYKNIYWNRFNIFSPAHRDYLKTMYDAVVFEADAAVDNLYKQLNELGLAEKTIVVITSDHGEEFMEHGNTLHRQLYQEIIHVPLIFIFPVQPKENRISEVVQSIDIGPTILQAVGAPLLPKAEGRSLLAFAEGKKYGLPHLLTFAGPWNGTYSVRDNRYTYLIRNSCPDAVMLSNQPETCMKEEFYDRAADPGELNNIFSVNKDTAAVFAAYLNEKIKAAAQSPQKPWPAGMSEEVKQRILRTGYW